jgi:predicted phosphodiesterase
MKVLLVGDSHGDAQFISSINKCAKTNGAHTIIQLGDFGFDFNQNVLASIRAWLDADERRRWLWIDGNHDHHDYIRADICKGKHPKKPVAHFHDRMFYCPRGSTLKIGSKKVLFLGGAVSIDMARRTQGVNWWPQEHLSTADVLRAIDNGHSADVLLCHDAPNTGYIKGWLKGQNYKIDRPSDGNRKAISAVIDQTPVYEVYHGHYHHAYTAEYGTALVTGLGANYSRGVHTPRAILGENCLLVDW